ncbi:uncharacterized protein EI90DRAFT_3057506 [Cantharellus anzutake]|uniref:uncharacterized protein n=1 Tax=Cantharellus anzutake TaxID=1750568 RepID=UPI0019068C6C|nr:uncharacterized protein EI90DRAFT_3057506 [Cantharellus anzutake]KAF8331316.1 hypothetical protein EI90DRAFT_3057506 [Cantharellus anzutake]
MFSMRNGGLLERVGANSAANPDARILLDGSDWVAPDSWSQNFVVVQDPFMPNENLTSNLSKSQWTEYRNLAKTFSHFLRSKPLWLAFGPDHLFPQPQPPPDPMIDRHIESFYLGSRPSKEVTASRMRTIQIIEKIIQQTFGASYTVQPFGSTVYGVDSPSTDLDLVIVDVDHANGFAPNVDIQRLPAVYNMRKLAAALRRAEFIGIRAIPGASTPIVKATHPTNRIQVDINANEQLGLYNTVLIGSYCQIYPMLRRLIFFIKQWAKSHALSDPSGAHGPKSMSSYCYTLMIISWLQTINVLPNLQADLPPAGDGEGFWIRAKAGRVWCDNRFERRLPPKRSRRYFDIGELLLGWFDYWGTRHQYATQGMSIRHGGRIMRQNPVAVSSGAIPFQPTHFSEGQPVAAYRFNHLYSHLADDTLKKNQEPSGSYQSGNRKARGTRTTTEESMSVDEVGITEENFRGMEMLGEGNPTQSPKSNSVLAEKAEVGDASEGYKGTEEDAEDAEDAEDLDVNPSDGEPPQWKNSLLLVADPFISAKNAAGGIRPEVIARFRSECVRSAQVITGGRPIQETFGSSEAIEALKQVLARRGEQLSSFPPADDPMLHYRSIEEKRREEEQEKQKGKQREKQGEEKQKGGKRRWEPRFVRTRFLDMLKKTQVTLVL